MYGAGDIYPQSTPVGQITKEQWAARSTPMVTGWNAHAAPMPQNEAPTQGQV